MGSGHGLLHAVVLHLTVSSYDPRCSACRWLSFAAQDLAKGHQVGHSLDRSKLLTGLGELSAGLLMLVPLALTRGMGSLIGLLMMCAAVTSHVLWLQDDSMVLVALLLLVMCAVNFSLHARAVPLIGSK